MVSIRIAVPEEKGRLWNMLQKYLYEMTNFYPDKMSSDGNFSYPYFGLYFTDADRYPCFIENGGEVIGFALLNAHSLSGSELDHALAEFTIFPRFRKSGFAEKAVRLIFEKYPGRWELKYSLENASAKKLWTKVSAPYSPQKITDGGEEIISFVVGEGECGATLIAN